MRANNTRQCGFVLGILWFLASFGANVVSAADELPDLLQEMSKQGKKAPDSLGKLIVEKIETDPKKAHDLISPKLRDENLPDVDLVVYTWAIGWSRNRDAVPQIIRISDTRGARSAELKRACAAALARLGGEKAGAVLLAQFDKAKDAEERYGLLDLLAQMQYEPALPRTIEILKMDPTPDSWQPVFVFGKMGDAAVPFLLKQINHDERNVRFNAIMILGQWLIPSEAVRPLQQRFWKEDDPEIRILILASLERTTLDLAAIGEFSQEVLAKEQNEKVRTFTQETVDGIPAMAKDLAEFKAKKKPNKAEFERNYAQLERSAGKEGSVHALAVTSSPGDEARLKKLRERILQRDSDEALYDYKDVNMVILGNRRLAAQPTTKPAK
jgi:hypothetical protein